MAMNMLFRALLVALGAALVLADDEAAPSRMEGVIRMGCGRFVSVGSFEPRVFGGIMIRGHGPILFARGIPVISHVIIRRMPAENPGEEKARGATSALPDADAEGFARATDSLFSLGHPLSLFREDLSELDRWHTARMRALESLQAHLMRTAAAGVQGEGIEGDVSDSATASNSVETKAEGAEKRELGEVASGEAGTASLATTSNIFGDDMPMKEMTDPEIIEWTVANFCGAFLLSLSFGLLVAMLLLSLSTLIYGCSDEASEPIVPADSTVETPLLKFLQAEEAAAVENPLCKYEPPTK